MAAITLAYFGYFLRAKGDTVLDCGKTNDRAPMKHSPQHRVVRGAFHDDEEETALTKKI